jgi:NAD(P)-dependent dehydrogenase (short-subunit alcohol dehydrogenase family)
MQQSTVKNYATFHDLEGANVFITGGGSGIGASLTDGFMEQGANVSFVQRSDAGEFILLMQEKHGRSPDFIKCDVTDVGALQQVIDQAQQANGPITVLVNNAANDNRHTLSGMSSAEWDAALNVNLRPHFITTQKVAPVMKAAGGGSIINFSSIAYMIGHDGFPAYMASKAAITGLTRGLARELGPDNIRVNALMPGWVLTQRQMQLWATEESLAFIR